MPGGENGESKGKRAIKPVIRSFIFKRLVCLSGPLPAFRSCFVKVAPHAGDLLMYFWGRKWFPCPILPSSWDCPLNRMF